MLFRSCDAFDCKPLTLADYEDTMWELVAGLGSLLFAVDFAASGHFVRLAIATVVFLWIGRRVLPRYAVLLLFARRALGRWHLGPRAILNTITLGVKMNRLFTPVLASPLSDCGTPAPNADGRTDSSFPSSARRRLRMGLFGNSRSTTRVTRWLWRSLLSPARSQHPSRPHRCVAHSVIRRSGG